MTKIEPALTAEEWTKCCVYDSTDATISADITESECLWLHDEEQMHGIAIDRLHALAALCLHGQPYGFTWEDVKLLRGEPCGCSHETEAHHKAALAARIAALLPPRDAEKS